MGDNGLAFLNDTNNTMNLTGGMFNCLSDNISSTSITDRSHWEIQENLKYGTPYVATVVLIFFLLSFFWNLFIIITYFVKYKLLKQPANIFLLNLAIADLLVAVTTILFSTVTEIAQEFVLGSTDVVRCGVCNFAGVFLIFMIAVSLHMLAVLSVDRFILLTWPLRYKKIMNRWKALVIVTIVWIIALGIAIPPVGGFGENEFNRRFGACLPRFTGNNPITGLSNFFYVAFVAGEALIPILVLAFTNVWTYRIVSKFLRRNFVRRRTFRGRENVPDEDRNHRKQQKQLIRVFGALLIAHIISWTPVLIVVFLIIFIPPQVLPGEVYIFGWICYLTNPVFHPIIESFFVKDLRYQVRRAKKTVKRAGSAVYRQSTRLFSRSALEEANAEMDKEEANGSTKEGRKIVFLKQQGRVKSELDTEMVDMDASTANHSGQNTPETPRKLKRKITFSDDQKRKPSQDVANDTNMPNNTAANNTAANNTAANHQTAVSKEEEVEENETHLQSPHMGTLV